MIEPNLAHDIAHSALKITWEDTESQARRVADHAAAVITNLQEELAALKLTAGGMQETINELNQRPHLDVWQARAILPGWKGDMAKRTEALAVCKDISDGVEWVNPVFWVHPAYFKTRIISADVSRGQLSGAQVPLFTHPSEHTLRMQCLEHMVLEYKQHTPRSMRHAISDYQEKYNVASLPEEDQYGYQEDQMGELEPED